MAGKGKKKVVVCVCSVPNKGDNLNCLKCYPQDDWVQHKGEDSGRATVPPQDEKSAEKGVQLSHQTNPRSG